MQSPCLFPQNKLEKSAGQYNKETDALIATEFCRDEVIWAESQESLYNQWLGAAECLLMPS